MVTQKLNPKKLWSLNQTNFRTRIARPIKKRLHARETGETSLEERKNAILLGMMAAFAAIYPGLPYTSLAIVCYILGIEPASKQIFFF